MKIKITQLAYLFQFLTLVCLPLYIVRFDIPLIYFNLPTTLLEALIWLSIIFTVGDFFQDHMDWIRLKTHFDPLIGLLLLSSLIAVFVSPDLRGGLGIFKAYFLEPVLFFYALIFTSQKKGAKFILVGLIIAASWLSLLGLLQKLTGAFSLAPHEIILGRISAVYNSANSLTLFLGPIIFLLIAIFFRLKKNRIFFLGLAIFYSLIIIWTKSRGGLIGEIIGLLIFAYGIVSLKINGLQKVWFIVPMGVVVVLTIFFYQMFSFYDNLILSQEGRSSDTLQVRFALWVGTANLLRDHPIFGAGLNGFKTLYSQSYRISPQQEELQYPHNIFLNFWAETGLAGLVFFLFIIARIYKLLIENLKRRDFYFGLGLICALSFWLVHGMVDVPYFKNDLSVEFWIIVSLVEVWVNGKQLMV